MEIISFLRETYWSKDYVVEVEGFKKVAKFVKEGLISSPFKLAVKKELLRNVQGLLVPERIEFLDVPVLIYDVPDYKLADLTRPEEADRFSQMLLSVVKNILHLPRIHVSVIGLHDLVTVNGEPFIFVPLIEKLPRDVSDEVGISLFVAPEFSTVGDREKSTLYVFGRILEAVSTNESVRLIARNMSAEKPEERRFEELIPYFSVGGRKMLKVKRVRREIEDQITQLAMKSEYRLIGVVGPQRSGKTTIIENIQNFFRERNVAFIHAVSSGDLIVQTLELTSDRISDRLLDELSFCLDNPCSIETVALSIVEALGTLETVVIFVDDYHEADNSLRTLLTKITQYSRETNARALAFSTEPFPEFEAILHIPPFDRLETERLILNSIGSVGNIELLSQWLQTVSGGLPGLMVGYLKRVYEEDLFEYREGMAHFDPDALEGLNFETVLLESVEVFVERPEAYVALLGQKFTESEVTVLESVTGFKFSLEEMIRHGVIYSEYNKLRFSLKQYWEALYSSIPLEERVRIHLSMAQHATELERKAWHLEMAGNKVAAARAYLKATYDALEYYYSPSYVKNLLERARTIIGQRFSYALTKFQIELASRAEDKRLAENTAVPSGKLCGLLKALRAYLLGDSVAVKDTLETFPEGYGRFGTLRRKLLSVANEFYFLQKRGDYYQIVKSIVEELDPNNPIHVRLLVEAYILLGNMVESKPESTEYLKRAEKLAIDFNVAHRLPTIYNNLSVNSSSVQVAIQYLKRAVEVALRIGLPARAYFAKINLLYHTLYSGKIQEFVDGLIEVKSRVGMLGLSSELRYANILEAVYHAYNFEIDEALAHLEQAERYSFSRREKIHLALERAIVHFIVRDLEKVRRLVDQIEPGDELELSEEQRLALSVFRSIGTEHLKEKWITFSDSSALLLREEILAVLGRELAVLCPGRVLEEFKYLEKRFIVDGSFLSLALIYEGFGNFYAVQRNNYKARVYYRKALGIYKDIGLANAYERLAVVFERNVGSKISITVTRDEGQSLYELISSLKIADVRINPESILDYFASKISQEIPFTELSLTITDGFLERTFSSTTGSQEVRKGDFFCTSPLEISFVGRIDDHATYHLYGANRSVSIPKEGTASLLKTLEVIDYAITTVFKSLLTTLRSYVDPLTKLYTRYYFSNVLEEQFRSIRQFGGVLTLVMCDIDNFKRVNDTYGHLLGDAVLKSISKIFRESVRHTDVVGRFGGEEFILAFPHTDLEEAIFVLERLRRLLREMEGFPFKVTLSFGVSHFREGMNKSVDDLIIEADTALYQAKNTGKDRIVVFTEGMTGGLHA